jgi:hypothetical protein
MIQIVGSIFVSVIAFAYHMYAMPYTENSLNILQGSCLFMIYLTLQAGMMLVTTSADGAAGSGVLIALSIANIIVMVSPAVMVCLVLFRVCPASCRRRVSGWIGYVRGCCVRSGLGRVVCLMIYLCACVSVSLPRASFFCVCVCVYLCVCVSLSLALSASRHFIISLCETLCVFATV